MTSAVKDGLMATVGSGGSFLPERHTPRWSALSPMVFTKVCFLVRARLGSQPCLPGMWQACSAGHGTTNALIFIPDVNL